MKQTMIFMSYRSGSKTLLNLLGASKDILQFKGLYPNGRSLKEKEFEKIFRGNFTAASDPSDICPVIYRRDGVDIPYISDKLKDNYSNVIYWTRLENEIHSSFEISNLSKLEGQWKFIIITRDGRNQVDSWINFRGKNKPKSVEGDKPFLDMCRGWQLRAAHTKCIIENFDCKLIKFEDLVQYPYICFNDIMKFIGIKPEQSYLEAVSEIVNVERTENKDRWKDWDQSKLNIFYDIAKEEMKYFNYI